MQADKKILAEIKKRVLQAEPDAKVILYGSYARGDANEDSDIDLLILVNKEKMSFAEKQKVEIPLYRLSYEGDIIISPLVQTQFDWENKYFYTTLYDSVQKEGVEI